MSVIRHRGHTARLDGFTYAMAQIPMTIWLSPEYIKRYPKKYNTLLSHTDSLFSNDMIYETMIGLANIKTDRYNAIYDLSSPKYTLDYKKALTLHGRLKYADSTNYYFWRKHNTKLLQENNLTKKIVINSCDTVGKLNEAWNLGYRSFELNLKYLSSTKTFEVGTKKYTLKGSILDLLSYFKINKIDKLFLNLTNLNELNIDNIISRLNYVDNKLHFKKKIIILVDKDNLLEAFKDKCFKVALTNKQNFTNSEVVDYLTIDNKNYNSIKSNNNLNIILTHTFNIADSKLQEKLKNLKYINNKDISFVFTDFTSEFDK